MDQALREFAAHLGVCEEAPGSQLAGNDWDFLDIDMAAIDLRSLPMSVICCNLEVGVFYDGRCRAPRWRVAMVLLAVITSVVVTVDA